MTDTSIPKDLSAEDVILWLQNNPDFLNKHPEACDLLTPPKQHTEQGRRVLDFQQFMVKRLKEDRDGIIEEAREIVETSRANMSNQTRIHNAVTLLLEARSFEDFIHILIMDFAALLDVDIITLVVEADGTDVPHINISGVHAVSAGTVALLMKKSRIILEENIAGLPEIYGGGAGLVKSQALLRLRIAKDAPDSIIAFGSRNPEHFAPGQATDLLNFLGNVIERSFARWLNLPPHP